MILMLSDHDDAIRNASQEKKGAQRYMRLLFALLPFPATDRIFLKQLPQFFLGAPEHPQTFAAGIKAGGGW
jgi:hypothetical protein